MARGCGRSRPETPGRDARPPGRPGCDCIRSDSWSTDSEREAQAAVNPTLADLAQSPYRRFLGQGVCDLRQAWRIRDSRKTVPLLGKAEARLARLAGDVFVAVQHHLRGERRMPADLDGQMAPIEV